MTRLSIIVPTPDGGELDRLHDSLRGQLVAHLDEVIVVGDTFHGDLSSVRDQVVGYGWRWLEYNAGYAAWGHPQVNYGMTQATGDYLVFQDDDDVFAPSALTYIRRATKHLRPPRPVIFKFKAARFGGIALPVGTDIGSGRIGGHCIVPPNVPGRLGRWSDRYEGDWDFIEETLALWEPHKPVFRPEVISLAR